MKIYLAIGNEETRNESISLFSICFDGSLFWAAGQHNLYRLNPVTEQWKCSKTKLVPCLFTESPAGCLAKKGNDIWVGTERGCFKINLTSREVMKENAFPALNFNINAIHVDKDSSIGSAPPEEALYITMKRRSF
jgi:hypothetical protein